MIIQADNGSFPSLFAVFRSVNSQNCKNGGPTVFFWFPWRFLKPWLRNLVWTIQNMHSGSLELFVIRVWTYFFPRTKNGKLKVSRESCLLKQVEEDVVPNQTGNGNIKLKPEVKIRVSGCGQVISIFPQRLSLLFYLFLNIVSSPQLSAEVISKKNNPK